jgi:hypothetical protein
MIAQNSQKSSRFKELWYSEAYFTNRLLTYFLIRLRIRHETQSQRLKDSFYRQEPNSLWSLVSPAEIFSENQSSLPSQPTSTIVSKKQSLQHCRGNLAVLYPIMLGLGRIETFHLLKHNGVFQYLTGLPAYPNPTTLRRFLLRMAPPALCRLRRPHDKLLLLMVQKSNIPKKVIFDLDSTVLTLYGKQQYAGIGYNPMKRGRPSYLPLLCFNGITKDFWHGELRPGNTHTSSGVLELLKASLLKLPSSVKVKMIRGDKGFYNHNTIEYLESQKAIFAIVAKVTRPIKRKLPSLSYKAYTSGTETSEFTYQPIKWKKSSVLSS